MYITKVYCVGKRFRITAFTEEWPSLLRKLLTNNFGKKLKENDLMVVTHGTLE